MNWDDPEERARLIEQIGPKAYNERLQAHLKASVLETVNGYDLRPVGTRFGTVIQVSGTDRACMTIEAARAYANSLPTKAGT